MVWSIKNYHQKVELIDELLVRLRTLVTECRENVSRQELVDIFAELRFNSSSARVILSRVLSQPNVAEGLKRNIFAYKDILEGISYDVNALEKTIMAADWMVNK